MIATENDLAKLIRAVDEASSAESLLKAVVNLANARLEGAIPTLVKVLGYNNPGAAVAAVEGLVSLGTVAVDYVLNHLDGYDYGARAWASRALARIGDPRALENLLEAAQGDFALSVRRSAAKGLGGIHWDSLTPEAAELAQMRTLKALLQVSRDGEWVVRYGAIAGLQGLAGARGSLWTEIRPRLEEMSIEDEELGVRARARWALQEARDYGSTQ